MSRNFSYKPMPLGLKSGLPPDILDGAPKMYSFLGAPKVSMSKYKAYFATNSSGHYHGYYHGDLPKMVHRYYSETYFVPTYNSGPTVWQGRDGRA